MTYREIMMQNNENLSWCKPLSFENGNVVVAFNEGTIVGIQIDGNNIDVTPDAITSVADRIKDMYDDPEELPCRLCPWFGICCAMDEEYPDCQC